MKQVITNCSGRGLYWPLGHFLPCMQQFVTFKASEGAAEGGVTPAGAAVLEEVIH